MNKQMRLSAQESARKHPNEIDSSNNVQGGEFLEPADFLMKPRNNYQTKTFLNSSNADMQPVLQNS